MNTSDILSKLLKYGQAYLVYQLHLNQDQELNTSDGAVLHCYMLRQAEQSASKIKRTAQFDFPDIDSEFVPPARYDWEGFARNRNRIMFHGNGMNYGDCIYAAKRFVMRRCNVLILSYRGYGDSEGTPSEKGLRLDAQAAIDHVKADPDLSQTPVILYGTSLGGAVAIDLTSRNPTRVSALIVENTFESLPRVVRDWPVVGNFSFFCFQKWNSASKVPLIPASTPILMLSGVQDEVVPKKHMDALWEIAQKRGGTNTVSKNDRFETFANGSHGMSIIFARPQCIC
ncbi:Alpha/Beta hydrolase protein [Mycena sp. CBHHK59/15]|nr:Alpha/Beta hydrolase protein [Mycena sp. CBHHK59/15]